MSEYESRFGYIYATVALRTVNAHEARVEVLIDDATRRPHSWGTWGVAIADESPEGVRVALTVATDRLVRDYGVIGMTWIERYDGSYIGCQWHPETNRPVNGREVAGSIRIAARPRHRKAA
jgi:hypothetical protein